MQRQPRLTSFDRKINTLHEKMQSEMEVAAQAELLRLWRDLNVKLRRIENNKLKIGKIDDIGDLKKQYYLSTNLWAEFRERLRKKITKIAFGFIALLILAYLDHAEEVTGIRGEIDERQMAKDYELDLAVRLAQTTTNMQRIIAKEVNDWYHNPHANKDDLIAKIESQFGDYRSKGIGIGEASIVHNDIVLAVANYVGANKWWWKSEKDRKVCDKKLKGPDGLTYNGCRQLHGHVFPITMRMPPESSHISCRCRPKLIFPSKLAKFANFVESEHPRETDSGKFTDKGNGGSKQITRFDLSDEYRETGKGPDGTADLRTIGGWGVSAFSSRKELEDAGYMAVYRGTNDAGIKQVRTAPGMMGDGAYFYTDPIAAASYAEMGGGVVTAYVHPEEVKTSDVPGRGYKLVIAGNVSGIIRRGVITTEKTLDRGTLQQAADEALDNVWGGYLDKDLGKAEFVESEHPRGQPENAGEFSENPNKTPKAPDQPDPEINEMDTGGGEQENGKENQKTTYPVSFIADAENNPQRWMHGFGEETPTPESANMLHSIVTNPDSKFTQSDWDGNAFTYSDGNPDHGDIRIARNVNGKYGASYVVNGKMTCYQNTGEDLLSAVRNLDDNHAELRGEPSPWDEDGNRIAKPFAQGSRAIGGGVSADSIVLPEDVTGEMHSISLNRPGGSYLYDYLAEHVIDKNTFELAKEWVANVKGNMDDAGAMSYLYSAVGEPERRKVKGRIVKELSDKTGLDSHKTNTIVHQWSESSNDENPESLLFQKAVSEEFGVELSSWQKEKVDRIFSNSERKNAQVQRKAVNDICYAADVYALVINELSNKAIKEAEERGDPYEYATTAVQQAIRAYDFKVPDNPYISEDDDHAFFDALRFSVRVGYDKDTIRRMVEGIVDKYSGPTLAFTEDEAKKTARAMYENTQEDFQYSMGLGPEDEITVFRGVGKLRVGGQVVSNGQDYVGRTIGTRGNAAESWSIHPKTAMDFGGVVLMSKVKVKNILATCMTGVGCLPESEVVVLGNNNGSAVVVKYWERKNE